MKKSFLTLLLTAFMLVFTASVAFAAETGSPINIPGQVVAEENGFRLIGIYCWTYCWFELHCS